MPAMFLILSCSTFAVSPSWTTALVPHTNPEIFNPLPAKLYWSLRPAVHQYALRSSPRAPQHYACPLPTLSTAIDLDLADVLPCSATRATRTQDASVGVPLRVATISYDRR